MVLEDEYLIEQGNTKKDTQSEAALAMALPLDRLAAVAIDVFVVLAPISSLISAPFKRNIDQALMLGNELTLYVNIFAMLVMVFATATCYFTVFTYYMGATLGKLFFGLRVVNIWSRNFPGFGKSLLRSAVWILEWGLLGLPNLTVMSNEKRRAIHDRISDTVVISIRNESVGEPTIIETSFVRGIYSAVLFLFTLITLTQVSQLYFDLKSNDQFMSLLEDEGILCREVGYALDGWPEEKGQRAERLSVAMALFAAGRVDEACLQSEVDSVFRHNADDGLAYLANSFVYADKPSLSNEYLDMVCQVEPDSDTCRMSKIIEFWTEDRWEDVRNEFANLEDNSQVYTSIWGIRHFINRNQHDEAMKLIEAVSPLKPMASFLGRYRAMAYWGQKRFDESRAAAQVAYENLDPIDQVDLASWICFESLDLGCSQVSESSCDIMNKYVSDNKEFLIDSRVALAHVKQQECLGETGVSYDELAEELPSEEGRKLASAMYFLTLKNKSGAAALLSEIADNENYDSYFREEAKRRLIKESEGTEDLNRFLVLWEDSEHNLEWEKTGAALFRRYYDEGHFDESFLVGKLLWSIRKTDEAFKRDVVVSGYYSGNKAEAWELTRLLESNEQTQLREPAAAKEFGRVRSSLSRDFGEP